MSSSEVVKAASQVAKAARRVTTKLRGVVVSAGLMDKTVKVRVGGQKWNKVVNKWFSDPKHYLVHDPNSSLRTGDVVCIVPGWPTSQHKRHVVDHIIAPYGTPIEERPPVPTLEERIADREAKKEAKRAARLERKKEASLAEMANSSEQTQLGKGSGEGEGSIQAEVTKDAADSSSAQDQSKS